MANKFDFKMPGLTHRTSIQGRTGSGKTVMGGWLLSQQAFDKQPFIMVDYKGDEMLQQIDRAKQIGLDEVPKHPGLYHLQPTPRIDDEAMEGWLWRVLAKEHIGLYFDETYMVPDKGGLQAVLTQGRSKHIPIIALSQRPAWLPKFVFSEADFFAVFHLSFRDDQKKVADMINGNAISPLPEYHSWWYDVKQARLAVMQPVPTPDEILDVFDDRLAPKRRFA